MTYYITDADALRHYSADCKTIDAALKSGKSGVLILFDEDDDKEPEVHAIGASHGNVTLEKGNTPESWSIAYEQLNENILAKRVAAGKAVREKHETVAPMQVRDAARIAQLSADYKAQRQAGMDRTAEIAARMKSEAAKLWGSKF